MLRKVIIKAVAIISTVIFALVLVCCNTPIANKNKLYYWHLDEYETDTRDILEFFYDGSCSGNILRYKSYIYYINGYEQREDIDNNWGVPVHNTIVRAKFNQDGHYTDPVVIVPKRVLTSAEGGGFVIIDDWIYYATPSINKDGSTSTTHIDFMRTRIDAKVTTLLATIEGRDIEYYFTSTKVLYKRACQSTVNYIDFSASIDTKSTANGKGIVQGVFLENVKDICWIYAENKPYIYYTTIEENVDGIVRNTLNRIKTDGTCNEVIIDQPSRLKLIDMNFGGSDGQLIYSKTTIQDGQEKSQGIFVCAITSFDFDPTTECFLMDETEYKEIVYLNYNDNHHGQAIVKKYDDKVYSIEISPDGNTEEKILDVEVGFIYVPSNDEYYYVDKSDNKFYVYNSWLEDGAVIFDENITAAIDWDTVEFKTFNLPWFMLTTQLIYFDESTGKLYSSPLDAIWVYDAEEKGFVYNGVTSYEITI